MTNGKDQMTRQRRKRHPDVCCGGLRRQDLAQRLGISYSQLRLYERPPGNLLAPEVRLGPNRTRLFSSKGLELLELAQGLHDNGVAMEHLQVALSKRGLSERELWLAWLSGAARRLRLTRRISDLERRLADVERRVTVLDAPSRQH